jgi:hypothetical protein
MPDSPMRFKEATASLFFFGCCWLGANIFPDAPPWVRGYLGVSTFFTTAYMLTDCVTKGRNIKWQDILSWPLLGCVTAAILIAMFFGAAIAWGFMRDHKDGISICLLVILVPLVILVLLVRGKSKADG